MVFAGGPTDWKVTNITTDTQWITNKAGTPEAAPWAKDSAGIAVTVKNNGEQNIPWVPFVTVTNPNGKVQSDGLNTNLDLTLTDINGTKTVIKGNTTNFQYTLKAGTEDGIVDIWAKFDGNEQIVGSIKIFGHSIQLFDYYTDWKDFCGKMYNVFGVDSTSPVGILSVQGHSSTDTAYGSTHLWETVNLQAWDQLSGVKNVITNTSPDGKTITWTITDNAGNITIKTSELRESWGEASILICEKCGAGLVNVGSLAGDGAFHVFAPGGWTYYKCPICGYSNEAFMRAAYKAFVARGGYVPTGDFYKGTGYNP